MIIRISTSVQVLLLPLVLIIHISRHRSRVLLRRMRMRRVVIVGQVEDLSPRRNVKHGDRVLGAPNEDHIVVGDGDLGRERLGRECVEFRARSVIDRQPLVLFVARIQEAVRRFGRRGAHQLGYCVRELFQVATVVLVLWVCCEYVQTSVSRIG